ncbi:MAG: Gfo/Idh/MocA family oxidoreductase, partial [Actinomycetota bacterium]|nr:Gfo/Idh/MocA family oxidoreductase [Actinomycetota bacterium]
PDVSLSGIYDSDSEKSRTFSKEHSIISFKNPEKLIESSDALVVALPTELHHEFALMALEHGRDCLVEKPISDNTENARELCGIAQKNGLILQVGHVERYNPVSLDLPRLIKEPISFSCERLSPFMPSWVSKTGVVLDLMIHDIDIVLSLLKKEIKKVSSAATKIHSQTEDLAFAQLTFENGVIANFQASRVSQTKIRNIKITQKNDYITADLMRRTISIYRLVTSDYFYDSRLGYKQESVMEMPYLSTYGEPLKLELEDFVDSIRTRKKPLVSGEDGATALEVALKIIESAES